MGGTTHETCRQPGRKERTCASYTSITGTNQHRVPLMRPLAMQNVLFVLDAALSGQAHAAEPPSVVSGPVRVIDGDTIVLINTNTHIRLNGVDAPEVVYDHDDDFGRKRAPRCAQSSAPPSCVAN
jgi:endonuclease YncB( thermonuclease family)